MMFTANAFALTILSTQAFQPTTFVGRPSTSTIPLGIMSNNGRDEDTSSRRSFLATLGVTLIGIPQAANAGIDVSGLRTDVVGNPALREQLKAYDGSASARVNQIKEMAPAMTTKTASPVPVAVVEEEQGPIATWLYRSAPGFNPRLSRAGALGNLYRYDDTVVAPAGSKARQYGVSFEFPSDWLQLDKFLGGISYVDQRNGDRLYVLRTKLPEGERLASVPKSFFGTSLFDPKGTIVKSQGVEIDDYKVASATTLSDCPDGSCATHRRFKIKYSTVTGTGLRVERRALVDAYEVSPNGGVYMLMTSSNAVKFEQKDSRERATVEAIVDSFRIDV